MTLRNQIDLSEFGNLFDETTSSSSIQEFISSISGNSQLTGTPEITKYSDGTFENYYSIGISLYFSADNKLKTTVQRSSDTENERRLDRIDIYNESYSPLASTSNTNPSMGSRKPRPKAPQKKYVRPPTLLLRFSNTTIDIPPIPENPIKDLPIPTNSTKLSSPKSSSSNSGTQTIHREKNWVIDHNTKAKEFVQKLGEPSRKGGGVGWVGPWLEWDSIELDMNIVYESSGEKRCDRVIKLGIMIELRPDSNHSQSQVNQDTTQLKSKGLSIWDQVGEWTWGVMKVFKTP